MKIGLVRHYKVKKGFPEKRWLTYGELAQWFREYDESDIEEEATDLQGIQWGKCYSSDLPRASRTAKAIYEGPIACTDELREIPLPHFKLQMRLPFLCWAIIVRLSAYLSRDTREKIAEGEKRIGAILDRVIEEGHDTLIVSHAALMMYMRKELRRRGFVGPSYRTPANGKLYLFERKKTH